MLRVRVRGAVATFVVRVPRAGRLTISGHGLRRVIRVLASGDDGEPFADLRSKALIGIRDGQRGEHRDLLHPRRRGAAHARLGIRSRDFRQNGRVVWAAAELLHGGDAHVRISRFVFGLKLEPIEERHRGALQNQLANW